MADNNLTDQQKTDEATLEQMQSIAQSVIDSQPLIAHSSTVDQALRSEYANNNDSPGFLPGLSYLDAKYAHMRRVRGDGNCFYRAVLFAYLETLTTQLSNENGDRTSSQQEYERFMRVIKQSKDELVAVGYDEFALETFYDTLVEFLESVPSMTPEELYVHFVEGGVADYYTWYMRLLTAGYLRLHGDRFFPFLADGLDIDMASYCAREVEPMGKECEQLHIIALTEYLGLRVSIEYLDGREFNAAAGLSCIHFPQQDNDSTNTGAGLCSFTLHLLYRPGHYDILYLQ